MEKRALFLIATIAAISLSACSNTPASTADSMVAETMASTVSTESAMPEETDSTAESTSSFEPVIELPDPVSEASKSTGTTSEAPAEHHAEVSPPPEAESSPEPTAQPPQPTEPAEPPATPDPVSTPEPPTTPEPIPTPEPSEQPVTPEPQPSEPAFDVSQYVGYAKSYGSGIGLTLDSSAVSCWDDPLTANAGCVYLERDIRDRLDWYSASGFTAFWVWSVDIGGGNFQIFIGYA
ncbi:MAG TPA: hypothetical protein DEB10_07605 [Ruminococcaceae bacterium]|nr:hypothetical protein [Oscillospiraceae bacterium]